MNSYFPDHNFLLASICVETIRAGDHNVRSNSCSYNCLKYSKLNATLRVSPYSSHHVFAELLVFGSPVNHFAWSRALVTLHMHGNTPVREWAKHFQEYKTSLQVAKFQTVHCSLTQFIKFKYNRSIEQNEHTS